MLKQPPEEPKTDQQNAQTEYSFIASVLQSQYINAVTQCTSSLLIGGYLHLTLAALTAIKGEMLKQPPEKPKTEKQNAKTENSLAACSSLRFSRANTSTQLHSAHHHC